MSTAGVRQLRRGVVVFLAAALALTGCSGTPMDQWSFVSQGLPAQSPAEPSSEPGAPADPDGGPAPLETTSRNPFSPCEPGLAGGFGRTYPGLEERGISVTCFDQSYSAGLLVDPITTRWVRVELPDTPSDASPLLVVAGPSLITSDLVLDWAATGHLDVLKDRPIIALNYPAVPDWHCAELDTELLAAGLGGATPSADTRFGQDSARSAGEALKYACDDVVPDPQDMPTVDLAITAIDQMRHALGVNRLAIMGVGGGAGGISGADLALHYAYYYPWSTARLMLDSPETPGSDWAERHHSAALGLDQAIADAYVECRALPGCTFADPAADAPTLLEAALRDGAAGLTPAQTWRIIEGFLGGLPSTSTPEGQSLRTARLLELSAVLTQGLGNASQVALYYAAGTGSGGMYARCLTAGYLPDQIELAEAGERIRAEAPITGAFYAFDLGTCVPFSGLMDTSIAGVEPPALTIVPQNSALTGSLTRSALQSAATRIGLTGHVLTWPGRGHLASAHSSCVAAATADFLTTGTTAQVPVCTVE